jgi:hypothetical protein
MVQEHGEYRALYAGVSDMWEAYEKWLATRLPQITLRPAATPVHLEAVLDPRTRPPTRSSTTGISHLLTHGWCCSRVRACVHCWRPRGKWQEAVRQLEEVLGAELPLEMRCSLRIRNGQDLTNLSGLLGGYSFYVRTTIITAVARAANTRPFYF